MLDEIIARLGKLPEAERKELEQQAMAATASMPWLPTFGPQTQAFLSDADDLFYGGQAGGGKTDLAVGLALTSHTDSLILRRVREDARDISDRIEEIIGTSKGCNSQLLRWKLPDRTIELGGCQAEQDKQRYKGRPHDLIVFDEVSDFLKSQFLFIKTWNRSAVPGQRSRVLATGNPPTTPEGLWVIEYWAAWLDPKHANPAKPGEIRWYTTDAEGKEIEVDGPGPHFIEYEDGRMEEVRARSRTFIPARLDDNPYLKDTDYGANLDSLPPELRAAYRDGRFDSALEDDLWQAIPTSWILAAQKRWTPLPPHGVPMCAIGVDPAQGGKDETVLAKRHDGWYAPLVSVPGVKTPFGKDVAGLVVAERRDGATVTVDMGGGYGGDTYSVLTDNNIEVKAYKGSEATPGRTRDGKLAFSNRRAEAYWKFREALDPSQPGGSTIMLPDDPRLVSDLTAPKYSVERNGIKLEPKEEVVARLGRSPDKGDAVVMAWYYGDRIALRPDGKWDSKRTPPKVVMGYNNRRRNSYG